MAKAKPRSKAKPKSKPKAKPKAEPKTRLQSKAASKNKLKNKRKTKPFRVGRSHTGLGLFATAPIAERSLVVEYRGRRIPTVRAQEIDQRRANKYLFEINTRWTIDGSSRRNLARYINHACEPNTEADLLRGRMMVRAIAAIAPGDEITIDYGEEYLELYFGKTGCLCATCTKAA